MALNNDPMALILDFAYISFRYVSLDLFVFFGGVFSIYGDSRKEILISNDLMLEQRV